jgi:putative aldouronate transport system substrate-binding protein
LGVFASAGPFLVVKLEDNTKYASLPPLTSSVSDQKMWPKSAGIVTGTFAISNKNPNPEASMRWVDYAYSPEGSIFFDQGPEGLGWKWEDDAHTKWMKPDAPAPYKSTEEYRGGKLTPSAGSLLPMFKSNDFYSRIDLPQANHIIDQVADKYAPYVKDTFPLIYFSDEDQNRLNVLESDIQTYVEQAEAKFITGHDSLDKWDSYVSTINKMGLSEMIDIYQKGYDRWKSVQ